MVKINKDAYSLEKVMAYTNEEVVYRFYDNYDVDIEEARDIFNELKRFLFLAAKYGDTQRIFTHEALYIIDEMWHTFILFTKDYHDFCMDHFGFFLHHNIVKRDVKMQAVKELEEDREKAAETLKPMLRKYYTLIYETLGEEVLVKWMKTYGSKYTKPYLNSIRRPIV